MARDKAIERYTSAHWGINPGHEYTVDDPDLPAFTVEMGKLREIAVEVDDKDAIDIVFNLQCHLVFTQDEAERLYCVLNPAKLRWCKRNLWDVGAKAGVTVMSLTAAAKRAGGRQAKYPYPRVQVMIVGIASDVIYFAEKKGDGPSNYHHLFGEESDIRPFLCVDAKGRVFLAGGNYTCPDAGITD